MIYGGWIGSLLHVGSCHNVGRIWTSRREVPRYRRVVGMWLVEYLGGDVTAGASWVWIWRPMQRRTVVGGVWRWVRAWMMILMGRIRMRLGDVCRAMLQLLCNRAVVRWQRMMLWTQ